MSGREDYPGMEILKGVGGLIFLVGVVFAAITLEFAAPWRRVRKIDFARWLRNAAMNFYGVVLLGLIPALAGYGAAVSAQAQGIGLFNILNTPIWIGMIGAVIAADILAYAQHRALHKWYLFWRLHRTHHTDVVIDATTSLRFHPLETLFRAATEIGVVYALGLPPEGVLLSYAVFVLFNVYTHFNVYLPLGLERRLAVVFITPRMHRLHHSAAPEHQYTNFGTILSLWDRLFGTMARPEILRKDEAFGVGGAEAMEADSFANLALDPFRKTDAGGAIPRPARLSENK